MLTMSMLVWWHSVVLFPLNKKASCLMVMLIEIVFPLCILLFRVVIYLTL
jgi:hypothetical protein